MNTQGQTVLEYVLLLGIVTLVLVYMGTDFRRGIQSVVKVTADQLGNQANADQDVRVDGRSSVLTNSYTKTWQNQQRIVEQGNGIITPKEGLFVETHTNSFTNVSGPS